MQLNDIAMIAADTIRSRAYIQALVRNDLHLNFVFILDSKSKQHKPGQINYSENQCITPSHKDIDECWSEAIFDPTELIKITLQKFDIPYVESNIDDINDSTVVDNIRHRPESVFVYSGFGGVLLREDILNTGKKFLHVHGGYLPDYKGSTTNYYSLISENIVGASSLFLNQEIDSGSILMRKKFPPPPDRKKIDYVYDSGARAKILVETIQSYLDVGEWNFESPASIGGETYYIIHPVLKHIAILARDKTF